MRFSLIIPCYNEGANLPLLLQNCKPVVEIEGVEIILVDNGSSDHTPDVLRDLLPHFPGCRSIRVENNQGYGHGILMGLNAAKGKLLGWTHADMQANPRDVIKGLELLENEDGQSFVKGRRYGRPMGDVLFTVGMSIFESLLLRQRLWDINAQPTIFSRQFFDSWDSPPRDFALDLYAYYQARRRGIRVKRFPVHFAKRAHGVSHWNVNWGAKWKFIRRTVDFSLELRKTIQL